MSKVIYIEVTNNAGIAIQIKKSAIITLNDMIKSGDYGETTIDAMKADFCAKNDITGETLETLFTGLEASKETGKREANQELMGLWRRLSNVLCSDVINVINPRVNPKETWSHLVKNEPQTVIAFLENASDIMGAMVQTVDQSENGFQHQLLFAKHPMDEKTGLMDTTKDINPNRLASVCQIGWDDGGKVQRYRRGDQMLPIVGKIEPVIVLDAGPNGENQPLNLANQNASGRSPKQSKKSGYCVNWPMESRPIDSFKPIETEPDKPAKSSKKPK